jgi:hypothetical protein
MTTIRTTVRVGPDGNIVLPVGLDEAGKEVEIVVTPAAPRLTQEQWKAILERTAGSIDDPSFFRHEQGEYDERESFE